ncbi:MAG: response regulator [Bdellovibrionota bacterium]
MRLSKTQNQLGDRVILTVDDDQATREVYGMVLASLGFHCIEASEAEQALKAVNEFELDLVIVDQRMPGMTGLEFVRKVRAQQLQFPVLLVSTGRELRRLAFEAGATEYLEKPFEIEDFISMIDHLVGSKPHAALA